MQIVFSRPDAVVPYGERKRGGNMRKIRQSNSKAPV